MKTGQLLWDNTIQQNIFPKSTIRSNYNSISSQTILPRQEDMCLNIKLNKKK